MALYKFRIIIIIITNTYEDDDDDVSAGQCGKNLLNQQSHLLLL